MAVKRISADLRLSVDLDDTVIPTRAPSTAYILGDVVAPQTPDGYFYECTTAGTSSATPEPLAWGATEVDGSVTWTRVKVTDSVVPSLDEMILTPTVPADREAGYALSNFVHDRANFDEKAVALQLTLSSGRVINATGALSLLKHRDADLSLGGRPGHGSEGGDVTYVRPAAGWVPSASFLSSTSTTDYLEATGQDTTLISGESQCCICVHSLSNSTAQQVQIEQSEVNVRNVSARYDISNTGLLQVGTSNGVSNCNYEFPQGVFRTASPAQAEQIIWLIDLSQATEYHSVEGNLGTPAKVRGFYRGVESVLVKTNGNIPGTAFDTQTPTEVWKVGGGQGGSSGLNGNVGPTYVWIGNNPSEAQINAMWTTHKGPFLVSEIAGLADPTMGWLFDGDLTAAFGGVDMVYQDTTPVFGDPLTQYRLSNDLNYADRHILHSGFEAYSDGDYYSAFASLEQIQDGEIGFLYSRGNSHAAVNTTGHILKTTNGRATVPIIGHGLEEDQINQVAGQPNRGMIALRTSTGRMLLANGKQQYPTGPQRQVHFDSNDDVNMDIASWVDRGILPETHDEFNALGSMIEMPTGEILAFMYGKNLLEGGYYVDMYISMNDGNSFTFLSNLLGFVGESIEWEESQALLMPDNTIELYVRRDDTQSIYRGILNPLGAAPANGYEVIGGAAGMSLVVPGWAWPVVARDPVSGRRVMVTRDQGATSDAPGSWYWSNVAGDIWTRGGTIQGGNDNSDPDQNLYVYTDIIVINNVFHSISAWETVANAGRCVLAYDVWDMELFRSLT